MKYFDVDEATDLPYWFLDVDGVLNCWPAPLFDQLMSSQDWRDEIVGRFKIWWQNPVVQRINELHEEGLAQIVWLTTWDREAADLLAPALGLPHFPVVSRGFGTTHQGVDWWKWHRVQELVLPSQYFVWTDDQLDLPMRSLVEEKYGNQGLLVTPESNPGLTLDHLSQVAQFLREIHG